MHTETCLSLSPITAYSKQNSKGSDLYPCREANYFSVETFLFALVIKDVLIHKKKLPVNLLELCRNSKFYFVSIVRVENN